jgi:hypoxanthine phosphoribosyltransferase
MKKVTWTEVEQLCQIIAAEVKHVDYIYGVPRGGLIPAVILSHLTGIPLIEDVGNQTKNVLVVDDVNDTGKTVTQYHNHYPYNETAVLFERSTTFEKSDIVGVIVEDDEWLVMPWEVAENAEKDMKQYLESRA